MSSENLGGTTFGQYELRELIGIGGMGAVYLAYQPGLDRKVAVKVLNNMAATDPRYAQRFTREAQMAASLEHPHIVPIYDYGVTPDGISYVVMRLLTGGSLAQRLDQLEARGESMPSLSETASLLQQIAGALDYAHDKNVIHRDIKPNNIVFDDRGNSYLVDFGIARLAAASDNSSATLTQTGMMVGTPPYMPPEVWRGGDWDKSSDQYALGIVIYEMMCGSPPFNATTLYDLINQHLHDIPELPANLRGEVPDTVVPVLLRALSKSPEDRYPTLTEFAQSFEQGIQSAGIKDMKSTGFFLMTLDNQPKFVTTTPRNLLPGATSSTIPVTLTSVPMSRRRKGILAGGAALILVLLAALAVIAVQSNSQNANLQGTVVALEATNAANPSFVSDDMRTATATVCVANSAPPQDGGTGEIAFHSDRSGNTNLYLMNADGTNVRRLTETNADDKNPMWSPDGSKLMFVSSRDGNNELYLLNADATDPDTFTTQRLTNNQADDADPTWSPDGKQIAFASMRDGNWDIYSVNADGSNLQRLTDHAANDQRPAWSPDGKQIAFASMRDGNQEVYIMNANGGDQKRITTSDANDGDTILWSPDGQKLVFVSIHTDGNWEIYLKDLLSDAAPIDITNLVGDEWQPSWTPDGKSLTYLWQTDNVDIMVANADGSNRRNLTAAPTDDWTYSWSPDGGHIAFETDRAGNWEIYTTDLCGGDVRRLTNNSANDYYPAWRPAPKS